MIWAHYMWWLVNRRIIYAYFGFGIPINIEIPYTGIPEFLHIFTNFYPVPIFFIIAGISLMLSIENKSQIGMSDIDIKKYVLKRSFFILFLGYIALNLIIKGPVNYFYASWGMLHLIGAGTFLTYFLLKVSKKFRITIALIIVAISPFINILLDYETIHYLYPVQGGPVYNMIYSGEFPMIPWISFVIIGSVIGESLINAFKDNKLISFLKNISILGILLMFIGAILPFFNLPPFTSFEKYPCTIPYFVFFTGAVIVSISIAYYFLDYKKKDFLFLQPVNIYGKFSLTIFIGHYFVGYRITKLLEIYGNFSYASAGIITISFYLVCYVMLIIWANYYNNKLSAEWIMRKISYSHFKEKNMSDLS